MPSFGYIADFAIHQHHSYNSSNLPPRVHNEAAHCNIPTFKWSSSTQLQSLTRYKRLSKGIKKGNQRWYGSLNTNTAGDSIPLALRTPYVPGQRVWHPCLWAVRLTKDSSRVFLGTSSEPVLWGEGAPVAGTQQQAPGVKLEWPGGKCELPDGPGRHVKALLLSWELGTCCCTHTACCFALHNCSQTFGAGAPPLIYFWRNWKEIEHPFIWCFC